MICCTRFNSWHKSRINRDLNSFGPHGAHSAHTMCQKKRSREAPLLPTTANLQSSTPPPMPELWATTWPLYVQYRVNSGFLVSVKLPRPPLPPQKQNDLDDPKQNPDLLQVLILFFTSERDLTEKVSQATISLFRHYRTTGIKHDVQVMSIQIFRGCTF